MQQHEPMAASTGALSPAWQEALKDTLASPQMEGLHTFLSERAKQNAVIYPPGPMVFNALNSTEPNNIKVLITGQDPYHGEGQAHGLAFSVQDGQRQPPSLVNIFKEMTADLRCSAPPTGNLLPWAHQGVVLLNSILTVEKSTPLAHKGKGWEHFTDAVIAHANAQAKPMVFIFWGDRAAKKRSLIDENRHLVITSVHPSPLSAYRGFFGSKPFSRANTFLRKNGRSTINWELA